MTTLTVRHVSTYRYRRPVMLGEHRMMFRPRDSYDQRLIDSRLNITPRPASLRWMHDVFGNCVAVAAFNASTDMLRFESTIRVAHYPSHAPDFQIDPAAKTYPFFYDPDELPDLAPSIRPAYSDSQDEVGRWARGFLSPGESTPKGKLLMTMTCAIREGFSYARRLEKGIQSPATTLLLRRGTCRDFALLMIEAVRALGFAARFVSGYIYVPSPVTSVTSAAGRPMLGVRSTCPARVGLNLIQQTGSSAIATSFGSRWQEALSRRYRCAAPMWAFRMTTSD